MAETATITIPARFNGPPTTGHGGYSCGAVAALLGAGPAEVSLRSPPPLERPLALERSAERVVVRDGDTLVAEGCPAELELEPPPAVSLEQAREANRRGLEWVGPAHPFPTCVVCGPERERGDGYRVFAGPVEERELFAADWTPDESLAGGDRLVRPECVWAALDCPSSSPAANWGAGPPIVLARLTASLEGPVEAGRPDVVSSWPIELDGRKRHTGVALFTADGQLLARARALWIELRG